MTLLSYNPSAKCVKCGSERVDTNWHSRNECDIDVVSFIQSTFSQFTQRLKRAACQSAETPHMLRHCSNCGYEWLEAPMDTAPKPSQFVGDIMSTAIWVFGWYWPQDITESGYPIVRPMVEFGEMTREEAESLTQQVKALKDKPIFAS